MERLNVYMAPLQGLTEAVFRNAFERHFGGVAAYYTPFVRREHGEVRRKDLRELAPERNRVGHLVPQLLAGTCEEACHIVEVIRDMGYREADLNMGCAFPMVVRRGKGCGILPFPEKVRELLRVAELYPDMAFSVKMRLGYETADGCSSIKASATEKCFSVLPRRAVILSYTTAMSVRQTTYWACNSPVWRCKA